jgi:hypothetical protein
MYTRVHTGSETIKPYLKSLLDNKICLLDYERIRDSNNEMLIGSSKLAGSVGMFNSFRLVGEFLLKRRNLNTPFLYTNGNAYMHKNLESCLLSLKKVMSYVEEDGGLS